MSEATALASHSQLSTEALVHRCADFVVTGDGAHPNWNRCTWHSLARVGKGAAPYATKAKFLYSDSGLYFLYHCQDRKLTVTPRQDFDNIFLEDVIELFLWPDITQRVYFEYELSPLNVELPIMVVNNDRGQFMGWQPWKYSERKIRKATVVTGGEKVCGAEVSAWSAEFFIPFELLAGLGNCPPASGSAWRANLYRIDYDQSPASQWAWCPDTGGDFHDFRRFGTLRFE